MIYTAIDTFYLTEDQLLDSPSRKDGVDEKTEYTLRIFGCTLVQEAGILLKLSQAVMATGQVLFHRFYCKKSFARFNVKRVAASCLWLAAKLEEQPRRIREVVHVFHRMEQRREGLPLDALDPFSQQFEKMKTDLVRTERHLLKEMGFICHVEHPHKFIFQYLQQLDVEDEQVRQEAWSLANDSLRTPLCVRLKSEVVACGVIYAAARRAAVPLPENPPWWLVFDAEKHEIDAVCRVLAELYAQPRPHYIVVEAKSNVLSTRAWEPPPDAIVKEVEVPKPEVDPPLQPPETVAVGEEKEENEGGEEGEEGGAMEVEYEVGQEAKGREKDEEGREPKAGEGETVSAREQKNGEGEAAPPPTDRDRDRNRIRETGRERGREGGQEGAEGSRERDHQRSEKSRGGGGNDSEGRHGSTARGDRGGSDRGGGRELPRSSNPRDDKSRWTRYYPYKRPPGR